MTSSQQPGKSQKSILSFFSPSSTITSSNASIKNGIASINSAPLNSTNASITLSASSISASSTLYPVVQNVRVSTTMMDSPIQTNAPAFDYSSADDVPLIGRLKASAIPNVMQSVQSSMMPSDTKHYKKENSNGPAGIKRAASDCRVIQEDDDDDTPLFLKRRNVQAPSSATAIMSIDSEEEEEESIKPKSKQSSSSVFSDEDDDRSLLSQFRLQSPLKDLVISSPRSTSQAKLSFTSSTLSVAASTEKKATKTSEPSNAQSKSSQDVNRYAWLQQSELRDAQGRKQSDPNYDPTTIYVPPAAWNRFTPFEQQYWKIKAVNWDCIVFFKKGKFYELYESDADIAARLFDLKVSGGADRANMRMAGVPEASIDSWLSRFLAAGYRCARVDQLENGVSQALRQKGQLTMPVPTEPAAPSKGKQSKASSTAATSSDDSSGGKDSKIIRRELTGILSAGLAIDAMPSDTASCYCMAIKAVYARCSKSNDFYSIGACLVDVSTGQFILPLMSASTEECREEELLGQLETS